jgi:dienelactone hydrolase
MRVLPGLLIITSVFAIAQESAPVYPDRQNLLLLRQGDGTLVPITTKEEWSAKVAHVRANFAKVAGPPPREWPTTPPRVEWLETSDHAGVEVRKLRYEAEPDDWVPALLLAPKQRPAQVPAALVLHQTTPRGKAEPAGLAGRPSMHIALELAQRGCMVLCPDYPNFGDYRIDVYAKGYVSATMKGIVNHRRAIDWLISTPGVDRERLGVFGHSLGGHNSLFLALFDDRPTFVATSCGFTSFPRYYGGNLKGWSHRGYMPRIAEVYRLDPQQMPFDFPEVLAAVAPRRTYICAPLRDDNFDVVGVRDCVAAAGPVYALFGARDRLVARYPDALHDFPEAERHEAYRWFLESPPSR